MKQAALSLFERSGLKSQVVRATFGSPLRKWRLGVAAGVVIPVVVLLMLLTSSRIRQGAPYTIYVVALLLTSMVASVIQPILGDQTNTGPVL
jgi:hypothetical protein